jgi:small conductance mechanosensitive channel
MNEVTSWMPAPEKLTELAIQYGGKLLLALITLVIGLWLINRLVRMIKKVFALRSFEQTLQSFLTSFISILLKVLLVISVVSMLGVQMTSFIALLGAAGLAVGMALSGTLQNFAGGVVLLILKPFKVGDFIEAAGFMGTVKEIQIFHTILATPDNKIIVIPNGTLSNGALTNFSTEPQRRVQWIVGIDYTSDIDLARSIVKDILESDSRVLKDPEIFIGVGELADSSVNLTIRAWTDGADFWPVFFDVNEKVKKRFDAKGIIIPFPQHTVHLQQEAN